MSLAGILAIQNRRNVRCETRVENFFGLRDTCGNAGHDLRVCQLLEGFVFGHACILAHARVQVQQPHRRWNSEQPRLASRRDD